jgi:peptidoglycan/xylan/chitin deacetylase (PgdA/CDA1 family)
VPAYFVVSLDTEFGWGYRLHQDQKMAKIIRDNEDEVTNIIDSLLRLFEVYAVPATWAIVGELFFERPEIMARIDESPIKHEIGYHSFSHIRFSDASRAAARTELDQALRIQDEFGIDFRSFSFPENEIGHVDLLSEYGFSIYRGPDNAGKSFHKGFPVRAKNFALQKIVAPPVEPRWRDTIWEIPSSMMFYDAPYFQTLVLRAKQGIGRAIMANSVFHLFLHPEDALRDQKLLDRLEKVLGFVKNESENEALCSITMGDLAEASTQKKSRAHVDTRTQGT